MDDDALSLGFFDSCVLYPLAADHTYRSVGWDACQYLREIGVADVPPSTVIALIRDNQLAGLERCLSGKLVGDVRITESAFSSTSTEVNFL